MRNVARSGTSTEFIFLIDIDTLPSINLRELFLAFATKNNLWGSEDNSVFVTPVFEIEEGYKMPEEKLVMGKNR